MTPTETIRERLAGVRAEIYAAIKCQINENGGILEFDTRPTFGDRFVTSLSTQDPQVSIFHETNSGSDESCEDLEKDVMPRMTTEELLELYEACCRENEY